MYHVYKIVQTLSPSILYIEFDIWLGFLWFIYIELLVFYIELTHLAQKFKKKKKKVDRTHGAKLNSNWNPIFMLN